MDFIILAFLAYAGFYDLKHRKVPNLISLGLIFGALFYRGLSGSFLPALYGAAIGMGWFLIPYMMGGMGAGDVKLLSGACAWFPFPESLYMALISSIAGAFLVVVLAFKRADYRLVWQSLPRGPRAFVKSIWSNGMDHRTEKVPYAISIAFGYAITLIVF